MLKHLKATLGPTFTKLYSWVPWPIGPGSSEAEVLGTNAVNTRPRNAGRGREDQ